MALSRRVSTQGAQVESKTSTLGAEFASDQRHDSGDERAVAQLDRAACRTHRSWHACSREIIGIILSPFVSVGRCRWVCLGFRRLAS